MAFDFRVRSKSERAATNHHDTIHPAAESTGKDAPGQVLRASDGRGKTQRRAPSARNNKRTRPKVRKLCRGKQRQSKVEKPSLLFVRSDKRSWIVLANPSSSQYKNYKLIYRRYAGKAVETNRLS